MRSQQKVENTFHQDEIYPKTTTRSQRRAGHIFEHSPSSSSASSIISQDSFILIQKQKPATTITTFLSPILKRYSPSHKISHFQTLRLRAVPNSGHNARRSSACLHIDPSSIAPVSPTFSIDLETRQAIRADDRRRKMIKLAKTFGENIPEELVFPREIEALGGEPSIQATRVEPNSKSVPRPAREQGPTPSTLTIAERRCGHRPRSLSLGSGTDTLATNAMWLAGSSKLETIIALPSRVDPPRSNSAPPRKPCSSAKSCRELALRSMTVKDKALMDGFGLPKSPPPFQTTVVPRPHTASPMPTVDKANFGHFRQSSHSSTRLPLRSSEIMPNFSRPTHFALSFSPLPEYGYRREREWSGEWNVKDMTAIVRELRDLKSQ